MDPPRENVFIGGDQAPNTVIDRKLGCLISLLIECSSKGEQIKIPPNTSKIGNGLALLITESRLVNSV